jgi:hypothetical protein
MLWVGAFVFLKKNYYLWCRGSNLDPVSAGKCSTTELHLQPNVHINF